MMQKIITHGVQELNIDPETVPPSARGGRVRA
jgi:hypothetical protein